MTERPQTLAVAGFKRTLIHYYICSVIMTRPAREITHFIQFR